MYLFVHHCDLRIYDNNTLNYLIDNKFDFAPIFVFTPEQITDNPLKSEKSIRFMLESLADLSNSYKKKDKEFVFYYGDTIEILEDLIKNHKGIQGIASNMDYSPYALDRDQLKRDLCDRYKLNYISLEDKLLNPVKSILTKKETIYTKFTPYYKNARENLVNKPKLISLEKNKIQTNTKDSFKLSSKYNVTLESFLDKFKEDPDVYIKGGRENALKILESIGNFEEYNEERNFPSINTTHLSAYLKFGCVSIREAYYAVLKNLGEDNELLKQFYWRDFYNMILFNFGSFDTPVSITKEKLNNIDWSSNGKENLEKWKRGMTGCPIVDAGMREMNTTGFMHNRCRMIVAMYLTYYLRIDWREGMRYFTQKLIDCDWANNVGNWEWVAGVEKWSNDYYKVFSMESQVSRFDPDCIYIKQWIPELIQVNPKDIIRWDTNYTKYSIKEYTEPILKNLKEARKIGIEMYKDALNT
jgi:deoxyribodipyrimidine photo-lyase